MEFFDRKEEVLEIQLTPEGKRLFSLGQFVPKFYEFYDNDVQYEANNGEEQNSSGPRIKETPRMRIQAVPHGIESELGKNKSQLIENINKNKALLVNPLGISAYDTEAAPAWNVSLLTGEIISSNQIYEPKKDLVQSIPQLNCETTYVYEIRNDVANKDSLSENKDDNIIFVSDVYPDQTYLVIHEINNIFADISEENAIFSKENFGIEVFSTEIVTGSAQYLQKSTEILTPKKFSIPETQTLTPEFVEYFFKVNVDAQTDLEAYKGIIKTQKSENYELGPKNLSFGDPNFDPNAKNSEGVCS